MTLEMPTAYSLAGKSSFRPQALLTSTTRLGLWIAKPKLPGDEGATTDLGCIHLKYKACLQRRVSRFTKTALRQRSEHIRRQESSHLRLFKNPGLTQECEAALRSCEQAKQDPSSSKCVAEELQETQYSACKKRHTQQLN